MKIATAVIAFAISKYTSIVIWHFTMIKNPPVKPRAPQAINLIAPIAWRYLPAMATADRGGQIGMKATLNVTGLFQISAQPQMRYWGSEAAVQHLGPFQSFCPLALYLLRVDYTYFFQS